MKNAPLLRARIAALTLSSLTAAAAGYWALSRAGVLGPGSDDPTVRIVDQGEEFRELLDTRANNDKNNKRTRDVGPNRLVGSAEEKAELVRLMARQEVPGRAYDPVLYYRRASNLALKMRFAEHPDGGWIVRTNDYGMRNDEDVLTEKPDLRILVTGDSHTDGVCPNDENFTHFLAERLREERPGQLIEVLNAGVGGYNIYHYLGVLERYAEELAPDVFVVVVFAGNDYTGTIKFQRYFQRWPGYETGPRRLQQLLDRGVGEDFHLSSQELGQLIYFLNNPADIEEVIKTSEAISLELQRIATAHGIELVIAFLPSPTRAQPQFYEEQLAVMREVLEIGDQELNTSEHITDAWLEFLVAKGIAHLDLRPAFREAEDLLYWRTNSHINLRGNELVAEALASFLAE